MCLPAFFRCGFARETGPRYIIPSEVQNFETKQVKQLWTFKDKEELFEMLKDFLHILYFRYLVVNPKDRRLVIVESVLCPTIFRETLAKVLFHHFEVPSILFVPSHLMAVYTLGISSALVIDVGYTETVVLPIFEKVPILSAWEAVPLGAQAIHRRLEAELMEKGKVKGSVSEEKVLGVVLNEPLSESVLEDIKARVCFVTPIERGHRLQEYNLKLRFPDAKSPVEVLEPCTPIPDVPYPLDGQKVLTIPGVLRELGPELLFEEDGDGQTVATIILESILRCAIDIRRILIENIVIMGGTAQMPGFKHRLLNEVKSLLTSPRYEKKLPMRTVKVHCPPAKENYVAWLGASIFGATDIVVNRSITRESYLQDGYIYDWSDQKWNERGTAKSA